MTCSPPPSRSLPPLFALLALPLAVLPTAFVFTLLAAHREELPPNLLLGAAVGGLAWVSAVAAAMVARALRRRILGDERAVAPAADAVVAGILSLVVVAFLVSFSVAPLLGILPVVAWGLPLPALLWGLWPTRHALRFTGAASGLFAAATGVVALAGPPRERPAKLAFAPAHDDDLVVLSWNLGKGPPVAFASDAEHLGHIARTIRESGAHVACLQEVDTEGHLERLLELLGPEWRGSLATESLNRSPAVLTRVGGGFAVETPEGAFFGGVRVRLERSGRALDVYSVHLAPARHAWLRAEEIDWYARRLAEIGVPAVVAGDMNIDPASPWDRLSSLFTEDLPLDVRSEARLSSVGFDPGRGGVSTGLPARRIDRVLVSRPLAAVDYEVLFGKRLGRMDHRPVRVRVGVSALPGGPLASRLTPSP